MSRRPFPQHSVPAPKPPTSSRRQALRALAAVALGLPVVAVIVGLVVLVSSGGLLHAYHVLAKRGVLPGIVSIHMRNDFSRPVVVALCRSDHSAVCEHPRYTVRVRAGRTTRLVVPTGLRAEWAVESLRGTLLRCIVLYWHRDPGSPQLVLLSQAPLWARPCAGVTPVRPA